MVANNTNTNNLSNKQLSADSSSARFFEFSNFIPNLYDLLTIKKNIIVAYPFELAASVVDNFCT